PEALIDPRLRRAPELSIELIIESSHSEPELGIELRIESSHSEPELGIELRIESSHSEPELGIELRIESSHSEPELGIELRIESSHSEPELGIELEPELNSELWRPAPTRAQAQLQAVPELGIELEHTRLSSQLGAGAQLHRAPELGIELEPEPEQELNSEPSSSSELELELGIELRRGSRARVPAQPRTEAVAIPDPIIEKAVAATQRARVSMIRKYTKKHDIQHFDIGAIVSIKVPREDRTSTDNKRLFARILEEPYLHRYQVLTLSGIIQRLIPTKSLGVVEQALWSDILIPTSTKQVTLGLAAREASTSARAKAEAGESRHCWKRSIEQFNIYYSIILLGGWAGQLVVGPAEPPSQILVVGPASWPTGQLGGWAGTYISERCTSARIATLYCYSSISLQYHMSSTSYDARVVLALKAIQNTKNLSIRAAAKIYENLTELEEEVIV
ncbi:hypothetical protein V500_00123, partial [Pseudogymnoascus sp. VKM F-4518 (FW-2643)]